MAFARASRRRLVKRRDARDGAADRLGALQAVTEAALAHLSLDALLDELLDRVRSILDADTVAVLLVDEEAGEVVARAAKGLEEEVERGVRVPLGQGLAGRVAAERRAIFVPDASPDTVVNPVLIEKGVRSLLGVPLLVGGRVVGVLHVGSLEPREFGEKDAELLQLVADRLALAIDHARLYESERAARAAAERDAEQLRQIQSITDVALGHFSLDDRLLLGLLERVQAVLEVDTAAILLLDSSGKELVARAAKGIEEEVERGVRIPVGGGFAGRIAKERTPVVLPDVRTADVVNPILTEKGIRSLLGVPLLVEGSVIGVLHVGTLSPRAFSSDDVSLLELAADRVAIAIDRLRQHTVAGVLQRNLLPPRLPPLPGVVMAARYLPGTDEARVGGDWYDVVPLPGGRVGIVMGDVVSRGVQAAAAMARFRTGLRAFALDGSPPGSVLTRLNRLARSGEDREMATIAYVAVEPSTGRLACALAGHPPPLVVSEAGETRFIEGGRGSPVGTAAGLRFGETEDAMAPGDTLVLYTDGLVESRNASLDEGLDRLAAAAAEARQWPEELCERVVSDLQSTDDDVAVLALRLIGTTAGRMELRVRATPDSLSAMRRSLGDWLARAGAGEHDAYDVVVAVGEAAANVVEHAYGPIDQQFDLLAEAAAAQVHVTITDRGRWRSARGENRGRGTHLMRTLMDHVEVASDANGTVVRMRRRLVRGEGE